MLHLSYTGKKQSLKSVVYKPLCVNVRELVYYSSTYLFPFEGQESQFMVKLKRLVIYWLHISIHMLNIWNLAFKTTTVYVLVYIDGQCGKGTEKESGNITKTSPTSLVSFLVKVKVHHLWVALVGASLLLFCVLCV